MSDDVPSHELLRLSAKIVSAHVASNSLAADGLPDLIRSVYAALSRAAGPDQSTAAPQEPAVPIKKSVFPGYLVCLEDGKKLKMLKRHLQSSYGMTPDQYRAKWQLPASYPMVAPDYAAHRSVRKAANPPFPCPAPADPCPAQSQRACAGADECKPVAQNLSLVSRSVSQTHPILPASVSRIRPISASQPADECKPLQIGRQQGWVSNTGATMGINAGGRINVGVVAALTCRRVPRMNGLPVAR